MHSKIAAIKNAASAAQLKAAVDAIPRIAVAPKIAPLANAANLSSNSGDDDNDGKGTTTLRCRNAKPEVRPESEFPHLEWTPGSKFTFFDYIREIDVVGDEK